MSRIFLSYSRRDETFARRLTGDLAQLDMDVWLDIEDIQPGMQWTAAIQAGLDAADVMILVISPESMASNNVTDEWQYFLDHDRPVIPVLLRPADVHYRLNRLQYIDFASQDYTVAFRQLADALRNVGVALPQMQAERQLREPPLSSETAPAAPEKRSREVGKPGLEDVIETRQVPRRARRPTIPLERYGLPVLLGAVFITALVFALWPSAESVEITVAPVFVALAVVLAVGMVAWELVRFYNRYNRPRVFMSYQRRSSAMAANYIAMILEQEYNISVFIDTRRQDGAAEFPARLLSEIRSHDVFMCLLSDTTFASEWVRREINEASRNDKPMIPIFQESYQEWIKSLGREYPKLDTKQAIKKAIDVGDDWDGINSLLRSDGIQFYDITNRFIDPAIKEISDMIRITVYTPRRR